MDIIVTTGFEVDGYRIVRYLGVVRGLTVRSTNILQLIFSGFRSIFGGRIKAMIRLCDASRQDAFDQMTEHARALGANAVVGMSYDSEGVSGGWAEIMAYGTAVMIEPSGSRA